MDLSSMQGVIVVIGPILLAIAIAWAMMHNRGSKRDIARTEAATRKMQDEQDLDDKHRNH